MNRVALGGAKFRRLINRQTLFVGLAVCLLWFLAVQIRGDSPQHWSKLGVQLPDLRKKPQRMPTHNVLPPLPERVPCHGPRGRLLGESPDDDLVDREIEGRTR